MNPIPTGHELRQAASTTWLCQCGYAIQMCPNSRIAQQRHAVHLAHVRDHRAHVKDCQKNKVQSELGGDAQDTHWSSAFRKPVTER